MGDPIVAPLAKSEQSSDWTPESEQSSDWTPPLPPLPEALTARWAAAVRPRRPAPAPAGGRRPLVLRWADFWPEFYLPESARGGTRERQALVRRVFADYAVREEALRDGRWAPLACDPAFAGAAGGAGAELRPEGAARGAGAELRPEGAAGGAGAPPTLVVASIFGRDRLALPRWALFLGENVADAAWVGAAAALSHAPAPAVAGVPNHACPLLYLMFEPALLYAPRVPAPAPPFFAGVAVSNGAAPERGLFLRRLLAAAAAAGLRVNSAGRFLNNMGGEGVPPAAAAAVAALRAEVDAAAAAEGGDGAGGEGAGGAGEGGEGAGGEGAALRPAPRGAPWTVPGGHSSTALMRFFARHQFAVCFENSAAPGYVTEKLGQAMLAGAVPVYWGCPEAARFVNPAAVVDVGALHRAALARHAPELQRGRTEAARRRVWAAAWGEACDAAVAEMLALARSPAAYAAKRAQPWLPPSGVPPEMTDARAAAAGRALVAAAAAPLPKD